MEVGGARLTRILSFMLVLYLLIHDGTFRGVSSCLSYLGFSARAFVSLGKVEQRIMLLACKLDLHPIE
jgi:hypothetical protein